MRILSIDTSCDETAAAVTEDTKILSNVIWSQASAHAKFGGVMPSLAQRIHEQRIDWVIDRCIRGSRLTINKIDAIAVTIGPGLSIALGVGINRAKKLAIKYGKKLIAVNHLEGHVLSALADSKRQVSNIKYPALGLVISGGNTILVKINKIGSYEMLAQTTDDALGEALDKGARMLGLGYPGGAILEKFARGGNVKAYGLPVPIAGQEERKMFTYSGLKTAFLRLVESEKPLTKEKITNLSACFQDVAFTHIIRVASFIIQDPKLHTNNQLRCQNLLVGGGVSANIELRKRVRKMGKQYGIEAFFPSSKKLTGDNAAMIGIAAYFKAQREEYIEPTKIDRNPGAKITD